VVPRIDRVHDYPCSAELYQPWNRVFLSQQISHRPAKQGLHLTLIDQDHYFISPLPTFAPAGTSAAAALPLHQRGIKGT
jgi:hypothetical protein